MRNGGPNEGRLKRLPLGHRERAPRRAAGRGRGEGRGGEGVRRRRVGNGSKLTEIISERARRAPKRTQSGGVRKRERRVGDLEKVVP